MPCIAETIRNHRERPVDWTDADKGRRAAEGLLTGYREVSVLVGDPAG